MKKEKQIKPPKAAEYILERILSEYNDFALLGDFNEEYSNIFRNQSTFKAKIWYWKQVFTSLPKLLIHLIYWGAIMISNYFKIALRNFARHKVYSFINVVGLAIGIASFILISMWVVDETSYDNFHEKKDNIYRVTYAENIGGEYSHYAVAPFPCAPAFKEDIPEIVDFTRFNNRTGLITVGEKKFDVKGITYVDSTFLKIFSFPLIKGDINTALTQPNTIVLTEKSAKMIFGNEDPIGKSLEINGDGQLTVTGIVADCPENSHIDFNYLVSWSTLEKREEGEVGTWLTINGWVYVLLDQSADISVVEDKMAAVVKKNIGQRADELGYKLYYFLQNIGDIHLNSHLIAEFGPGGDSDYVKIFSLVAVFVLLLACINFMNLSTAKSVTRSKEVGLRKVLGAHRGKLIYQFITESFVMTLFGFFIAMFIITLVLPFFSDITGKSYTIIYLLNPIYLLSIIATLLITGIIAGSYPAFYISSFQPAQVLKNQSLKGRKGGLLRNILVTFQFVVSILLAACTVIILQQINLMKDTKLGFNKEQVLILRNKSNNIYNQSAAFKNSLLQNHNILNCAYTSGVPGDIGYVLSIFQESKTERDAINSAVIFCDFGLLETLNLELVAGRDFSQSFVSDSNGVFIVNETMANKLGGVEKCLTDKIGFRVERTNPIVGVVKDFYYESVKNPVGALAIKLLPESFNLTAIKISPKNIDETIAFINDTYRQFEPDRAFTYSFLDKDFEKQYIAEERAGRIVTIFSILSGIIAILGLFGLSSYTTSQRIKEIGIRKVLGGSSIQINYMIIKSFVKLVILANLIALPLAYHIMNYYWLPDFTIRMNISWAFLVLLGLATVLLAILTVLFQSTKATSANPVDSLRSE